MLQTLNNKHTPFNYSWLRVYCITVYTTHKKITIIFRAMKIPYGDVCVYEEIWC